MKTIIFDIDGTITNMWPIEKSILLYMTDKKFEKDIDKIKLSGISDTYEIFLKLFKQKMNKKKYTDFYNKSFFALLKKDELPKPKKLFLVKWLIINSNKYRYVYATGGQRPETIYVLKSLNLYKYFEIENSIDKTVCPFSKKTGIPFKKIKSKFKDCILISDTKTDCRSAALVKIPFVLLKTDKNHSSLVSNPFLK